MLTRARPVFFSLACATLAACGSSGSDGGSGSGLPSVTSSTASTGTSASSGTLGGLSTGGSSASGETSGTLGGLSTDGSSASASSGVGGGLSTGGPTTSGSSAGGGTGGSAGAGSTSGVSSASGGAQGTGGASGVGGTQGSGGAGAAGTTGSGGAVSYETCPDTRWKLVWGDDFDGAPGAAVDGSKWAYDSGPNWYNGELQDYTSGATNASLDGNGNLVIEARKEAREGRQYTSARLKTEGKKTFTYGRFEGRMKLPYGQGMWPAFWMLGGNSWPANGEIDIMENLGREPSIAHGTMHGPGYSGADGPGASFTLPGGAKFSDDFHVFAIEWEPNAIRWYVDGELYSTKTPADTNGNPWVFDHPFFIILNLAVGGDWPGNPDETTVFPQQMLIDYIHVCEE